MAMLLEDVADIAGGTVTVRRVGIPWHHVREYERIPADAQTDGEAPPERPDA